MTNSPLMFYFGPWREAGHYLFTENGWSAGRTANQLPWLVYSHEDGIDCQLQPGCYLDKNNRWQHKEEVEGLAQIIHKDGWTALSFWDRSVDKRGACNSTYFAEGTFDFGQMVEMAKTRFAERWNKMKFDVILYTGEQNDGQ